MLLSSKTSQELATAEGRAKLRNQIRKIINETIGASRIARWWLVWCSPRLLFSNNRG